MTSQKMAPSLGYIDCLIDVEGTLPAASIMRARLDRLLHNGDKRQMDTAMEGNQKHCYLKKAEQFWVCSSLVISVRPPS